MMYIYIYIYVCIYVITYYQAEKEFTPRVSYKSHSHRTI